MPPHELEDAELAKRYPLALLSPASRHVLNSTFASLPWHRGRLGPPRVHLHPLDAGERGIESGARVRVHNDRGVVHAPRPSSTTPRSPASRSPTSSSGRSCSGRAEHVNVDDPRARRRPRRQPDVPRQPGADRARSHVIARRRVLHVVSATRSHLPPFEQVIELHGPAVLRFCAAQAGADRAEDVFQETMLAALRAYDELRDAAAIRSWLFSIAARKAVDAHRASARAPEPVADLEPPAADDDVPVRDDGIWRLVRSLPGKQRTAVTLRYLADLSHREIAEVMGTSEDAAQAQRVRGPQAAARAQRGRDRHEHCHHDEHARSPGASTRWPGTTCAASSTSADSRSREPLLSGDECEALADLFDGGRFRSTIDMARYRFGDGRYRYFDHPLPDAIAELRSAFYRHLAPIANAWSSLLGGDDDAFPLEHDELLARCRAAGQERPTPLILRYGAGDWNALHQDLYGDVFFPFQVLTVLSEPAWTTRAASSC